MAKNKTNAEKKNSLGSETWKRFKRNKLAMIGLYFLLFLVLVSIATLIIDLVTNKSFYEAKLITQDLYNRLRPPSKGHIFGLDEFGRDILLRVIWGTRYSLFTGIATVALSIVIGGLLGAVAGFYGGVVDSVIMRIMDIFLAIPAMILAMSIVAALGQGLFNVMLAVAISYVPQFARVVRASVMQIKDQEFIEATRALGASDVRIIYRYIIPNSLAPIIVQGTLCLAGAILYIASLSFIGLGIEPPMPEWGAMLTNARTYIRDAWHITLFPGLAIMLTILSLNLMGDGLRDAMDPKMKR